MMLNAIVTMADTVSHSCNETPRDLSVAFLDFLWQALHRLTHAFHHPLKSIPL